MTRPGGWHHTQETKDIISDMKCGIRLTSEHRMKLSLSRIGQHHSLETCVKISKANTGMKLTEEQHNHMKKAMKQRWENPEYRAKVKLIRNSPEYKSRMSRSVKRLFEDPEYGKKVMHRRIPSKPEIQMDTLLKSLDLQYEYVGNGSMWIGCRNPDFINRDRSQIIEVWGDFYHKGQEPRLRIEYFNTFGFKTLIIWASELLNESQVTSKILAFEEL